MTESDLARISAAGLSKDKVMEIKAKKLAHKMSGKVRPKHCIQRDDDGVFASGP